MKPKHQKITRILTHYGWGALIKKQWTSLGTIYVVLLDGETDPRDLWVSDLV